MSDNSAAGMRKRHAEAAIDYVDEAITRIEQAYQLKGVTMDERVVLALEIVQQAVTDARVMIEEVYANATKEERTDA